MDAILHHPSPSGDSLIIGLSSNLTQNPLDFLPLEFCHSIMATLQPLLAGSPPAEMHQSTKEFLQILYALAEESLDACSPPSSLN